MFKDRFLKKVNKTDTCWIWNASRCGGNNMNYGQFWYKGKRDYAHRVSYKIFKGDIKAGLVIDHLCKNTLCVNPEHLETVTPRENLIRGDSPSAINNRKTNCLNGHEFTPENTYFHGPLKKKRGCRHCRDLRNGCLKARLRSKTPA